MGKEKGRVVGKVWCWEEKNMKKNGEEERKKNKI